jgi:aspartyl protease family protein
MRPSTVLLFAALPIGAAAVAVPQKFMSMEAGRSAATIAVAEVTPAAASQLSGTARIAGRGDGHFEVSGRIGARHVPFLVDTGATLVALSWETGRDLGLVSPGDRMDVAVSTANGRLRAKSVIIPRLGIESLEVSAVKAVVLPPGAMTGNLLGMSFLGRLKTFEVRRDTLVLEQ